MRIFIGIDLSSEIRERLARFLEGVQAFAPEARWVHPESLHITLKFIGEQTPEQVAAITERLHAYRERRVRDSLRWISDSFPPPRLHAYSGSEFKLDRNSPNLAESIDMATAELGIPREDRPYSPHLTLARAGGRSGSPKRQKGDSPNTTFAVLEKRLAAMGELDFGTMMAREFILYQSQLSPGGSKYTKLQRVSVAIAQTMT